MRMRTFLHGRTKLSAGLLPALALSAAILLFSGCAALGGGVSQIQDDNEQTERTTANSEPTMAQADERAENSVANESDGEPADTTSEAGGAEVATGGGSVVVRAGDAEVTTGAGGAVARAGDVVAESGVGNGGAKSSASSEGGSGGAADGDSDGVAELRLAGDAGTAFSGDCVVGGEPTTLEGEVPARLDYDLAEGGLACEIGKQGSGLLRVVLIAGDSRVVRETNAEDARIELVYRNGNVIASTSSESGSSTSSSNSVSSSSQSSSSSSVQNQSSNSSSSNSSSINQSVSATN